MGASWCGSPTRMTSRPLTSCASSLGSVAWPRSLMNPRMFSRHHRPLVVQQELLSAQPCLQGVETAGAERCSRPRSPRWGYVQAAMNCHFPDAAGRLTRWSNAKELVLACCAYGGIDHLGLPCASGTGEDESSRTTRATPRRASALACHWRKMR